ncbi:MAG: GTPase ObgE [Spartobacteria bacterium]|nr:GTPase ObgE [Spartobacteria bacterium]
MVFKDRVKIYVASGNGGNGCVSFRREKFIPMGGPDGGDGGRGGHVYFVADKNVNSLLSLYYQPHQKAEHGQAGQGKQCYGRNGKDLYIKVPCGTIIKDEHGEKVYGEVIEDGETLLFAPGGKGGLGNIHFKRSTHQAPRESTPGEAGEEHTLWLELKLIADVGLVGYPNAGKSTLISKISQAHPKIAAYPFTTLNPVIGVVQFDNYHTLSVADIPGLIDGAHEGVGLGHDFLRHIERNKLLLYVLDMAGVDGRDPVSDFNNLKRELALHDASLAERPLLVAANKMDLSEAKEHLDTFITETGITPIEISAEKCEGIDTLLDALYRHFYGADGSAGSNDSGRRPYANLSGST